MDNLMISLKEFRKIESEILKELRHNAFNSRENYKEYLCGSVTIGKLDSRVSKLHYKNKTINNVHNS
jgi:hypothetical protein